MNENDDEIAKMLLQGEIMQTKPDEYQLLN